MLSFRGPSRELCRRPKVRARRARCRWRATPRSCWRWARRSPAPRVSLPAGHVSTSVAWRPGSDQSAGAAATAGLGGLDSVTALSLGRVQGAVGLANQVVGIDSVLGQAGDAEAGGDRPGLASSVRSICAGASRPLDRPWRSVSGSSSRNPRLRSGPRSRWRGWSA